MACLSIVGVLRCTNLPIRQSTSLSAPADIRRHCRRRYCQLPGDPGRVLGGCRRRQRAGRYHALLQSASERAHLHRAMAFPGRHSGWILLRVCPHPIRQCNHRRRPVFDSPRRENGSGRGQSGSLPKHLLCQRWLALYRQIQLYRYRRRIYRADESDSG